MDLDTTKLIVFTDGASRGNPGPGAYAYIIYDRNKREVRRGGKQLNYTTNNIAEYKGVIAGLEEAISHSPQEIEVNTDSLLVCAQLSGKYKVNSVALQHFHDTIKALIKNTISSVSVFHIPRKNNTEADSYVNEIMDSYKQNPNNSDKVRDEVRRTEADD